MWYAIVLPLGFLAYLVISHYESIVIDIIYRNYRHIYEEHVDLSAPQANIIMPISMTFEIVIGGGYKTQMDENDHKYPRRLRLTYLFIVISLITMAVYSIAT